MSGRLIIQPEGKGALSVVLESGAVLDADGQELGRIDGKTGGVFRGAKQVGQIAKGGIVSEGSSQRGRLEKSGTLKAGTREVGRIDDQGAIFLRDAKWGTASSADFDSKRLVTAVLAFFTNDFIQAPVKSAPAASPSGIQISHDSVRWAFIDDDGTITMESGVRAGAIDASGLVTREDGIRLGSIDASGHLTREDGVRLGAVQADGQLVHDGGADGGRVDKDGRIVAASGATWGFVEGCGSTEKLHRVAATLVFFAPGFFGDRHR